MLKKFRQGGHPMLHVDAGDMFFQPHSSEHSPRNPDYAPQAARKSDLVVEIMNEVGLDAFTPGELDFQMGVDHLLRLQKRCEFPWVSANIRRQKDGDLLFDGRANR